MHVQSIAGSARSLFEISLDIALLHQDQTNNSVERIEAFTRVERYRVAMKLVDYYANRPVPADLSINQQRAIVADPAQLVILDCYEAAGVELHLNAAIPQWADHLFFLQHAIGMALVDERLRSLGEPVRFTYLEPHEHETDR